MRNTAFVPAPVYGWERSEMHPIKKKPLEELGRNTLGLVLSKITLIMVFRAVEL